MPISSHTLPEGLRALSAFALMKVKITSLSSGYLLCHERMGGNRSYHNPQPTAGLPSFDAGQ
ncbi:hypothetical protein [Rhizobium jaguaris]|uniref:Uncharacterized protein n=1 Tax=Rhizobium jaguaris TaxID=1312183 RepID=A0A387G7Y3_9HYPH|nr:hypothetical protein [Rhizobium jaguaris]AYG63576.1 hypothetical protein CCGE525_33605 [Rhizobium jaguaris]